jgi:hypothetical protein
VIFPNTVPPFYSQRPLSQLLLAGVFERFPLAGNAAALYGFDLGKLAPLGAAYGPTVAELAEPLTELPEHPNQALLIGAR